MGNQATKDKTEEDPCHKLACKIQSCLQNSNYNMEACKFEQQQYNDCIKETTAKAWQQEQEKKQQQQQKSK
ncbi:hypothetical protein D3C80_2083840 [compost metagenome]